MKKQKTDSDTRDKGYTGIYITLITLIIVCLLVLFYFAGIMFVPGFVDKMLTIPVLNTITTVLVGEEDETEFAMEEEKVTEEKTTQAVTTTEQEEIVYSTLLLEQDKVSEEYLDDCVFLGDSRTVAMVEMGFLEEMQTLAEVGLSHMEAYKHSYTFQTSGYCYDMESYLLQKQPKIVYLSYGINGLSYTEEEEYKTAFEELVDKVISWAPDSAIVLEAIWPIREGYAATRGIQNDKVEAYNEFLFDLAKEKEIYYLDIDSLLKDDYNAMKQEYNCGDGLHYNKTAYVDVFEYILTHPVPEWNQ